MHFPGVLAEVVQRGLAIDVLSTGSWPALAVAGASLAGLRIWLGPFSPIDWWLAGTVLGGGVLAALIPAARAIGAAVILGTLGLAAVLAPPWTTARFLADDGPLLAHADLFERLRGRATPHDRAQLAVPVNDIGFGEKTAELFEIQSITDYETQITQRYAEYLTMLPQRPAFAELEPSLLSRPVEREGPAMVAHRPGGSPPPRRGQESR